VSAVVSIPFIENPGPMWPLSGAVCWRGHTERTERRIQCASLVLTTDQLLARAAEVLRIAETASAAETMRFGGSQCGLRRRRRSGGDWRSRH
jgi:hypothetical protein